MLLKRTHFHWLCFQKTTFVSDKVRPSKKASLFDDIKALKNSILIYSEKLTSIFNECLINILLGFLTKRLIMKRKTIVQCVCSQPSFQNCLKNYYLNKLMIICKNILKDLTDFRKNHGTQNVLLVMIENWKAIFNIKLKVGALLMDL